MDGLRESAAWLDLSARGKIRVTGEDRARLLHAMTTQDVQSLAPGQGCYAFFLNAQGRILGDVNIFCREDSFLLDTEPETRQKLYDHIDRYIIADDVTLEDITGEMATLAIEGPQAATVLERLGAPVPEADYATRSWSGSIVARVSSTGAGGYSVFMLPTKKAELIAALDIPEATPEQARAVRLEHGKPRYGEEITERYLVQETAQLNAVSFSKGCYLGQEIVERVRSRAQIHSTNGYESRRQNAFADLGSSKLKAAAAASAIALVTTKLAPGQSTDGAVFYPNQGKPLGTGKLILNMAGETYVFPLEDAAAVKLEHEHARVP